MLAGGTPAAADDPAAGRQVANMCRTCHGMDGYAQIPIAPHIGGEPQEYLEAQLMAFKTGTRQHEMMSIVAGGLSAQQISDVAVSLHDEARTATVRGRVMKVPRGDGEMVGMRSDRVIFSPMKAGMPSTHL